MTRAGLLVLIVAGCAAPEAPPAPTYFTDVRPILMANCARCHGASPESPAAGAFRLDRYVSGETEEPDAFDYADAIVRTAVYQLSPAMPPDYELSERQKDVLLRWAEADAPKGERDNSAPEAALTGVDDGATVDDVIELELHSSDADLDGLHAQLWARDRTDVNVPDVPLSPVLGAGTHALTVDTGVLPSQHEIELYALLDDGYADDPMQNRTVATLAGLRIDHGARGAAPAVRLLSPSRGGTHVGELEIAWSATDADTGDTLTITLDLMTEENGVVQSIATAAPNTGALTWTVPTDLDTNAHYRVRVTATDPASNTRSDASPVTLALAAPQPAAGRWEDVRGLFVQYCVECHGEPARSPAIDYFRLDKYQLTDARPPATPDLGAFEQRALILDRLGRLDRNEEGQMPPAYRDAPSVEDLAAMRAWLLAGAPREPGTNARPTFAWRAPTAPQADGEVTLEWEATDAEGLGYGILEYTPRPSSVANGCTDLRFAAWTPIGDAQFREAGATTWTSTFTWTPPPTDGYYCLRATVTDLAQQSRVVINPYGVR